MIFLLCDLLVVRDLDFGYCLSYELEEEEQGNELDALPRSENAHLMNWRVAFVLLPSSLSVACSGVILDGRE